MRLQELIERLRAFNGITRNSKDVTDNFVFVAIKGAKVDGHRFIDEAINRGAKAIVTQCHVSGVMCQDKNVKFIKVEDTRKALAQLVAEFYGKPAEKLKIVGVTGTNGKTTVTYLLEALLKEAGFNPAVVGTINYRYNNKIIPSKNTTPGPLELQPHLAQMRKEKVDYVVMEVSSHSQDQERTEGLKFHSAIFTNLTQDHLDYHRTMANYFQAKAKLFKNLKSDALAVLNNDDKYARKILELTRARVITYGLDNKADITAKDIKFSIDKSEFTIAGLKKELQINSCLIGRHNVYNILAAVAWGWGNSFKPQVIKKAIEGKLLVPGRLQRILTQKKFCVFVDYAHTEDALRSVITALRPLCKARIIVVFGCGGDRDKGKRPKMGYAATQLADFAVITSDNPRSENPEAIIEDIKKGIKKDNFCVIPERLAAIRKSLRLAGPGDIILIAGKGHEDYQIFKDRIERFDDREAVRACLESVSC
ncbi:MAG: UDP-N-acetylmuramoyl-L-alanyl-D-glutamate--2,6-diaminopimelate ligase [Candidatus Omnitrophota bacterium]